MGFWNIRSLLLAAFVISHSITWTVSKHHYTHNVFGHRSRHRRQGAGLFLSASHVNPEGEGRGPWGEWGEVSPCSRTCGGGVASQKRICLEVDPYGRPQCTGGDTKYISCETQDCPEGSKDFRAEQCSEYDNQPFRGVVYSKWVPYTKAPNPCMLTCMPHGERFYRPIKNVVDGTRCYEDFFDVCVNGTCQPVGCDMMLGSNAREDKCRECRGNGTNCRTVTGLIDTQELIQGYNDVLLIPQGATSVSIQERKPSNNYLAIRSRETNEYYLNGNYHISSPQTFPVAGTNCRYERSQLGFAAVDILKCLGPTNETLYLSLLLLQELNIGIEYEYSIPTAMAPPPNQEYAWVHDEFSPCSATCGGGIQTRKVTCRSREELDEVEDRLCDIYLKPATNQTCGNNPCQARWIEGPWSECSKPCGQGGVRSRQVHCEKVITNGYPSLVKDEECFGLLGPKPELFQECNKDAACPSWFTGPWKPCDKLYGEGKQTRQVVCHQKIDGKVEVLSEDACTDKKPPAEKTCLLHPSEGVDWVLSDWSGCDNCLSQKRTRIAECVTEDRNIVNASLCAYHPAPVLEEKCDENELPACSFQWYATQWSNCSVECGKGVQSRRVFCGRFNGESVSKVDDEKCELEDKYKDTKDCEIPEDKCPAKWFAGPWTECSKTCGRGEQHRKVMCLSRGKVVNTCDEDTILDQDQNCNDIPCDKDETLPLDARTTPIIDDDEDYDDCEDEDYIDEPTDMDKMMSDSPFPTDEGSAESTLYTASESDFTSETGSGTEITFETSSVTSESTETGSTNTDETESTETGTTETGTTETGTSETGSTESTSDYDTTEIITTESGLTEDTSDASETTSAETSESSPTSTDVTETDSSTTSGTETETGTTSSDVTETTGTGSTEIDSSETTETSTTESDYTETTETGTADTDSSETTETGSTESDSSETMETETTPTDITETTETGTTESDITETTETGTTPTDITETTETGTTESDTSETTVTGSTPTDITETTETGTTESDSSETTETGTTPTDITETTETGTTESDSSETTETGTTTTDITETTETGTTESDSSETTETGTTLTDITETTETGTTESDSSETTGTGSTLTDITETTETGTTETDISETTETGSDTSTESSTPNTGSTEETISTSETSESTTESGSTDTSEISSTDTDFTNTTESTITDSTATGETGSTETEETSSTDESSTPWDWATTVDEFTKRPKCKRRKAPKCKKSRFGCCPDEITPAAGPFDGGCPAYTTCKETKFGCCPDGLSPAHGPNNRDCPLPQCKETLYGCCKSDKKTPAEGNNQEGCPPPPPACKSSKNGCCKDEKTAAKGPNGKGCPENEPKLENKNATRAKGCAESEFGCCFDNETQATGPNEEGCPCSATEFNCCPDGISPARGLQMEGCAASCNTSEYGCCPDNETPAHGPEQEGCCLQYPFGCCPDNYKPAEGPHLEGCGCQYAHFGCCPDNVTIARGPRNEGCGCQYTQHGCCPDRHTEASGPDFEGCACHTFQFGCCPDGITKSTGPGLTGCRCQYSQYGCCGDDETAATGPNKEGCNCANSKYGCCPDGQTEAKGEKFLGCTDKPENRQAACALDTERGPCHNFTVYWFYDKEYGGCSRFWYGGCEGNGNKFVNNEECHSVCVQPSPKEACQLPKVHGACKSYIPKWYYDSEREQCGQFIYGGCLGNANNFDTREACQSQCEPARDEDTCTLPIEGGSCAGSYERWGFNAQAGRCERFIWGGCEGNTNRFTTEAACVQRCDPPGAQKPQCSEPQEVGNCTSKVATWSFSETENRCVPFYYTGCGGNGNKFSSEQECNQACPTIPVQDVCTKPASVGDCADYREKWYYDTAIKRCRTFYYGGCGGNGNNFNSEQECENSCSENALTTTTQRTVPTTPTYGLEYCFLELDPGPCNMMRTMYGYDSSLGRCVTFEYGGCGGNSNNFERIEECERYCSHAQDACQLPMSTGPCRASIMMWFYDASTDSCSQFTYGGCEGNENRFESRGDCERRCRAAPTPQTTPTPVRTTPQIVSPECRTPDSFEPCGDNITVFYYNAEQRSCLSGFFGGCRYANSYRTEEECERRCGAFRDIDVCAAQVDQGPCRAAIPKFYFDRASGRCTEFVYGGCLGGSNRFSTQDECEEVCGRPETDPCQLQPEPGNCLAAMEMWYYDTNRDQCERFYYSGCQGNANRFNSQADCEGRCRSGAQPVTNIPPAQQSSDDCRTPDSLEPCGDNATIFYYNAEQERCLSGFFGGCRYANSYRTEEECERRCGAFRDLDVCSAQLDPGPCRAAIPKFYFDRPSGRCIEYAYGGCHGGSNRFSTQDECEEVCGSAGPEAACLESLSRGAPCGGASGVALRRWYYSVDDADCRAFIYEGCDGNNNNFGSYQECENRCLPRLHDTAPQVANCTYLEQECASLRCEYALQRTRTAEGCEKCSCVTVDVDCTPLKEQCATLQCHYDIDRVMGEDGCERCRCTEHPCEKINCPSDERCVATPYRDPLTQAVRYKAECRIVNKPGACSAEEAGDNLAASSCRRECNDDADCAGASKCCARGCSQRCEPPAPAPSSAAPTTPPPTTPYHPELPQAPQADVQTTEPEVTSAEGDKATLRCYFHGNPPPTITWRRGEITIDGSVGRYRILSDGSLEIVSLYRNDTGVYICIADNGLGTAKQEVRLQVTDPVNREAGIAGEEGASETGELGQPLTLRCLAYGYPEPSINWYHGPNGGTMVPFDSVLYESTRDGRLLIRSLNLDTLGEYACLAYNGQGRATSWNVVVRAWAPAGYRNYANNPYIVEREVQVTPRPATSPPPPPPTTTPPPVFTAPVHTRIMSESGTVAAGSELSLPCEVDGYPVPRVHWTKDGSMLSPSARITITDARLTIVGLTESDAGEYGCHARNEYSSYDSTINIKVRGITIPEQCTDNPFFADCHLIVKSNFCTHAYYSKFCCKSCVEAGQLNPSLLRLDDTWHYKK